jgi:large subunit ribosomal protein L22
MQVKAQAKYIRISPRKVRLVIDEVRGLDLQEALNRLTLLEKKASSNIEKLVKSALANAEHNLELSKDNLFIKEITADDGPTYYRWMPRAFGRATPLRKRTSIIKLVLEEKKPTKPKAKKKTVMPKTEVLDKKLADKPDAKKLDSNKKAPVASSEQEASKEETVDVKQKGGFRDMSQQQMQEKKQKGLFKKMFRRKSGM